MTPNVPPPNENRPADPEKGPIVTITVDLKEIKIHRGRHSVKEIKEVGGVPLAYVLTQVEAGQLVPLPDDGFVIIHGKEVFKSHPQDGTSS